MKVAVFTSLTSAYIPNGRILAKSVARHHPEWDLFLLFNDRTPDFIRWDDEPFREVIFGEWLNPEGRWHEFAYKYTVVELCTATKGLMAEYLLDRGYDAVVYLDPDTCVFSPLVDVVEALAGKRWDVVLTPHLTDREWSRDAVISHEIAALKHGTFNLGFFAVANRSNGRHFLRWWAQRLVDFSYIDFQSGLFTDQKWCNLAPYLFDGVLVLTKRTYNVATWNATNRALQRREDGQWLVNGEPLIFYHFSGFGNDFSWADHELKTFCKEDAALHELWSWYKEQYLANRLSQAAPPWFWGQDSYGRKIDSGMRARARSSRELNPYEIV